MQSPFEWPVHMVAPTMEAPGMRTESTLVCATAFGPLGWETGKCKLPAGMGLIVHFVSIPYPTLSHNMIAICCRAMPKRGRPIDHRCRQR